MSVVANVAINVDARSAVGQLKAVQSQAKQTEQAFDGVSAAVGKLAIAAAAIQGARFIFAKTAELETQTRSLQVLTGSVEKAKRIIEELQQLGAVTPFTSTELIDTAKRLQAFGVTADKVVETTRRLADVSGATGAELQGLATAYGQVQAKGRLQGEELLQFQERGVALQEELRKMYGLSGEAFQQALSKGRISAEAVEVAVKRLTDAGGKYADGAIAQSDTLAGKLSTLQDGVDELARKAGQVLQPAVKSVLDYVINNIGQANQLIVDMGLAWQFVTGKLQPFIDGLTIVQSALNNLRPPAWMITGLVGSTGPGQIFNWMQRGRNVIGAMAAQQRGKANLYGRYAAPATQVRIGQQVGALPPLLGGGVGSKAGGGGKAGKSEAEKQAEILQKSYATGVQIGVELTRQLKLQNATNEFEEKRLKIQFEYRDRIKEISELKNKEQRDILSVRAGALRDLELAKLKTEELTKQREELERIQKDIEDAAGADWSAFGGKNVMSFTSWGAAMEETQRQLDELTNPINQVVAGATAIGSAFAESFRGIVSGSMTAQEALANFFRSTASHFLDMAAQIASAAITNSIVQFIGKAATAGIGSIGGGGFGGSGIDWAQTPSIGGVPDLPGLALASGGFVTGPTSAMIGEGGQPEYVIPASKMRGAMQRYAGGARGAAVIPGSNQAAGADGGMAAAAGPIDVRYSVERINSVDYVTADQFQRGMQQAASQGAQRGEQRALRSLQQSTAVRSRVGMR